MPNIALGITELQGILGRDYGIEEPYWGPSKHKTINLTWRENDLLQTNNKLKPHMTWVLNPGQIGRRPVLSTLCHPCSTITPLEISIQSVQKSGV